ncbi:MAG: hypothetical protein Q9207_008029 [Kuettlingeria erythrocarpa]
MAILKDVEVRVVSKTTGRLLDEYEKPGTDMGDGTSVERYIEAKTGEDFQIEVFIKKGFEFWGASGVKIGIEIDGGVVAYAKYMPKKFVAVRQAAGNPVLLDSVAHLDGTQWSKVGFRFGSLSTSESKSSQPEDPLTKRNADEEIDMPQEELDCRATSLGLIDVCLQRVNRKRLPKPVARKNGYTPLTTLEAPKELLKDKHISNVMQPGERTPVNIGLKENKSVPYKDQRSGRINFQFRYRSEMHLGLLGCLPRDPTSPVPFSTKDDTSVVPAEDAQSCAAVEGDPAAVKAEVEETAESNNVIRLTSAALNDDHNSLVEEVRQLKQQLKETHERQANMMQMFMGVSNSAMHAASGTSNNVSSPAEFSSPQPTSVKREHIKQEDDNETSSQVPRSGSRPAKKAKVIIELD